LHTTIEGGYITGPWYGVSEAGTANFNIISNVAFGATAVNKIVLLGSASYAFNNGMARNSGTLLLGGGTAPACAYGTDLVISATDATKVTSITHNFVAADVGSRLQITAGTGFTASDYYSTSVSSNAALLSQNAGSTSSTGGVWSLNRSVTVNVEGAAGAADTFVTCRQAADNSYSWVAH